MRSQFDKNKETLCDEIERLSEEKMSDAIAAKLSAYRGAYKALCMIEKGLEQSVPSSEYADKRSASADTVGDAEFQRLLISVPADKAHMRALANVFARHMEDLAIINKRAYESIMLKIKDVARD